MKIETYKSRIPDSPLFKAKPLITGHLRGSKPMGLHNGITQKENHEICRTDKLSRSLNQNNNVSSRKPQRAGKQDRYTIPIIVPSDYALQPYDQQTKWYIFFRFRKTPNGKLQAVCKKVDINTFKGRAKVKRAEAIRKEYEVSLRDGKNPFGEDEKVEAPINENEFAYLQTKPIPEALEIIFKLQDSTWSKKTISTYLSSRRIFEKFLLEKGWSKRTVYDFNKSMAKTYSDWLMATGYDLTTHHNHMRMGGTFFGYMVEREIIEINPFMKIKRIRDGSGGHLPFNGAQIKKIMDYCKVSYKPAVLFTEFTLETLMRSAELRKMKISDIDFEKGVIAIVNNKRAGKQTKDKQSRWIEISKELLQKMKKHCAGHPPDFLVFGKGFMPCDYNGWRSDISKEYTEILRGLKFGPEYTLYSLRHTGAASMAGSGINMYKLMQVLGHSSFDVTEKYLRGISMYMK